MQMSVALFVRTVLKYYHTHGRAMPWRDTTDSYRIYVSEVMLQQTQVSRVLQKYPVFIQEYPNFAAIAAAGLTDVLRMWQGMGYNRRAKFLHQASHIIVNTYAGTLPSNTEELLKLPGIGVATAGSIACFAFNARTAFIETNIRRAILYHFHPRSSDVSDRQVMTVVEACLSEIDRLNKATYRTWYYALMDYGAYLSQAVPNANVRSKHYNKQKKFEGSDRQIRGALLRRYLTGGVVRLKDEREKRLWAVLQSEGLVPAHHPLHTS